MLGKVPGQARGALIRKNGHGLVYIIHCSHDQKQRYELSILRAAAKLAPNLPATQRLYHFPIATSLI